MGDDLGIQSWNQRERVIGHFAQLATGIQGMSEVVVLGGTSSVIDG